MAESDDDALEPPTFEEAVAEARELLNALDDTSLWDMNALFYEHGYWQLFFALETLLRTIDGEHDGG